MTTYWQSFDARGGAGLLGLIALLCGPSAAAQDVAAPQDAPPAKARTLIDRVAAVIESEALTLREVEKKAEPYFEQLERISDPAVRAARRQEILRQVLDIEIGDRLVAREIEGNKDKLGVTEQDIDRAVDEVMRINRISRDQLQQALYGQGMTWSEYRNTLRAQIERARLVQFKLQGRVQIKDADVKQRCLQRAGGTLGTQVCASHILFATTPGMQADAVEDLRLRASKIQAELAAGADFAAYALKYSADTGTPDGALGCFGKGEMVDTFERAAFATAVGDVSPVVRTEFGFHIIKVTDRRQASSGSCSSAEDLAPFRNELYQEEMDAQMKLWIQELRRKAFVEVRL